MDDLISRKAARIAVYGYEMQTGIAEMPLEFAHNKIDEVPSVPAVPLDKLCEWLSECSINIPCTSCKNFANEYCTAIGDESRPCPKSADSWRRAITEWMEEHNAAD